MNHFRTILAAAGCWLLASCAVGHAVPVMTVNGLNADYGTSHVFVDELAGDSVPLAILFTPGQSNLTAVEVFSNLNRRDRASQDANGDGVEDGILPPDANAITAGDDGNYHKAYAMMATATPGQYLLTLNAQKAGAYRLTARYKVAGDTNWNWYSTGGRRDFAVVVSPKKALNVSLYELNVPTIGAQGTSSSQRSTFTDLFNGPGSRAYDAVTNRFNLGYVTNLGVNWLWLQPIHPIGVDSSVGSPYCVKNFFEVAPLLSKGNTRAAAMQEFTNFVAAADAAGVNVMLDAVFNHTARDCELAASGVTNFGGVGNPGNWQPGDQLRNREPRFYSLASNYWNRASAAGNIAIATDRVNIKFNDVFDVFFGVYSALVNTNGASTNNYTSTADAFDYTVSPGNFDPVTQHVWHYFADCLLFWLDKTGCPTNYNQLSTINSSRGIDGIRGDFAEGVPSQAWEYIINKTRSRKWDFVFLGESLNGGNPTYRSARHFDIVNDAVLYDFRTVSTTTNYRNTFNNRRTSYGSALMLWNNASHDVGGYYTDPFQALIRYMAGSAIEGVPMIFYGQELGTTNGFGFSRYQTNGTELVPDFFVQNSLQPIFAPANRTYALDQLYPVFAAVGQARQSSPALRSANRQFLDQVGGGTPANIFSVAKFAATNAAPNLSDVVFAFVNLSRDVARSATFNLNISANGANLFGIKSGRTYNFKNLAAYTALDATRRDQFVLPSGVAGSSLISSGLLVSLNPVPASDGAWATAPFEAKYLKLLDVTPPPTPGVPTTPKSYAIGSIAVFSWPAVVDAEGGVSGYHLRVGTTPGGSNVFDGLVVGTSQAVSNNFGQTLYARVSAINNAGIEGAASPNSSGTILLDPSGDADSDGMVNASEDFAGTDPLNPNSLLRILNLSNGNLLTWSSVSGKVYQVQRGTDLNANLALVSGLITATNSTTSFLDTNVTGPSRFYRVNLLP